MREEPRPLAEVDKPMEGPGVSTKFAAPRNRWSEYLDRQGVPESLLALLTLLVYSRSLTMGFVYDDRSNVFGTPWSLSWKSLAACFTQNFDAEHASNFYRPLTSLWTRLVYWLAGTSPIAWHLVSVLLHVVCVLLVFRLVCSLLRGNRALAMLAAAIFAVHPTHVEAVTWVSDAADPLMTILVLLSALALLRWLMGGSPICLGASWLLATASCFVKETGVLTPVLLLALALSVENRRSEPAMVFASLSFFASSCGFVILRSEILHGFAHPLSPAGNREMFMTWPAALWFYISHLFLPANLGPFYPLAFVSDWRSPGFVLPLLLLGATLVVLLWAFRHLCEGRLFWFCGVWMFVPLIAPLYLKLFPEYELVHDRYLYIPSIALAVALAAGLKKTTSALPARIPANYWVVAIALVLTAAAGETISYQAVWQSDIALFQRALERTPRNARAMVNLGVAQLESGNYPAGTALLKSALEIQPNNAFAIFDLGNAAWNRHDVATAEDYFQKALGIESHSNWWILLARTKFDLGKTSEAEWAVQQALAIDPRGAGAHLLLGAISLSRGDPVIAVREFTTELQLYPNNTTALRALRVAQKQLSSGQD